MLKLKESKADEVIDKINFKIDFKSKKLATAVAQSLSDNDILMVAFMDKVAAKKTLISGIMHYYTRSRDKIWLKGETSGNIQKVEDAYLDCDGDAILFKIDQLKKSDDGDIFCPQCVEFNPNCDHLERIKVKSGGVACHTKKRSCFFRKITKDGVD